MLLFKGYDAVIFDCDGVILDSNFIKIQVMEKALIALHDNRSEINECVSYFAANFGLTRFKHVEKFIDAFLTIDDSKKEMFRDKLLELYSFGCELLYPTSEITPGFLAFKGRLNLPCFVASGSEQNQLRMTLRLKGLANSFKKILGSPTSKVENINFLKTSNEFSSYVLIGDSVQDYESSKKAGIDFIAYTPFSADKKALVKCCEENNIPMVETWEALI